MIYFPHYILNLIKVFVFPWVQELRPWASHCKGPVLGRWCIVSTSDSDLSFASFKLWQPPQRFLCQEGITECKWYKQNCLGLGALFNPKWTFLSETFHRARAAQEVNAFLSVPWAGTDLFPGVIFLAFGVSKDLPNERKLDSCFSDCRSDQDKISCRKQRC